jgi:hypothetical protein
MGTVKTAPEHPCRESGIFDHSPLLDMPGFETTRDMLYDHDPIGPDAYAVERGAERREDAQGLAAARVRRTWRAECTLTILSAVRVAGRRGPGHAFEETAWDSVTCGNAHWSLSPKGCPRPP